MEPVRSGKYLNNSTEMENVKYFYNLTHKLFVIFSWSSFFLFEYQKHNVNIMQEWIIFMWHHILNTSSSNFPSALLLYTQCPSISQFLGGVTKNDNKKRPKK